MSADEPSDNPFTCFEDDSADLCPARSGPIRGVPWVLRWAASATMLCFSSGVVAEFAYCLVAEHALARAARAGALEATLPRATAETIADAVGRRLANYRAATKHLQLVVRQNGKQTFGRFVPRPNDRISLTVTLPTAAVLPRWLQSIRFWRSGPPITANAEQTVPGRNLASI